MVSSVQITSLTRELMCVLSTWFYNDVNGQLKSRPLHIRMTVLNISCRAPKHILHRKSSWKNLNGGLGWKDKSSAVIWLSFCWIKDWQWRVWWRACRNGGLYYWIVWWNEEKERWSPKWRHGSGAVCVCLFVYVHSCVAYLYLRICIALLPCFVCMSNVQV